MNDFFKTSLPSSLCISLERFFFFTLSFTFLLGFFYPLTSLLTIFLLKKHRKLFWITSMGFLIGLGFHILRNDHPRLGSGSGIFVVDGYRSSFFGAQICLGHMERFTFNTGENIKNLPAAV